MATYRVWLTILLPILRNMTYAHTQEYNRYRYKKCTCTRCKNRGTAKNKSDISYLKTSRSFDVLIHSSQTLLVSDTVGTTSSCSLLAFLLSVSLVSSRIRCLCFSVPSRSRNCGRLATHSSYTTEQPSKLPKSAEGRKSKLPWWVCTPTMVCMHMWWRTSSH